ncbi:unnamed protein product [Phyllotreta striolata]|uniref:Uncharacterized protein n=1 Tax=Phyllotreta striolata TaxID=444603 RepID=A0A9N9TMH7_PHYSR|nr:unnamed protein product [Phyllotreta striolata]
MEEKTSILKRKSLNCTIANETVTEDVVNKDKARRVSFSSKNYVKHFMVDDEKNTMWDSTYEETANQLDEANKLESAALSSDMELTCLSTTTRQVDNLVLSNTLMIDENNTTNDSSVDMELTRMSFGRDAISYSKENNQAQLNDPPAVENRRSVCRTFANDEQINGRLSVDMELTRNLQVNIARMETNLDDMEFTAVLNTKIQENPINQNFNTPTPEDIELPQTEVDKENVPVANINIIRVDILRSQETTCKEIIQSNQSNMDFTNVDPTYKAPIGGKFSILNEFDSKENSTESERLQFPSTEDVSILLETSDPCVSMSDIENDDVNSSISDSSYAEDSQFFDELQYIQQINLLVSQVQNRRSLDDTVLGECVDGALQQSMQEVASCISAIDDTVRKLKQAIATNVAESNREHEELLNRFKQAESFFSEFQWPKIPLVPFKELEKAQWESKSLEEKIEDYNRSSSQFWEYKKKENADCFCFCTFHSLVCFKVYAHPISGVVRDIEAFDNISSDAPAILFYLALCVRETMKRKKLSQVLTDSYTIFSLLDYMDLFMVDLKKFEMEYERLENSHFRMIRGDTEQTFIFRCVFVAPEFLIGWKIMLGMSAKNIGSFSSLEVEIDEVMGEIVNKNTIWNLAKGLKGCKSLRTFTGRVHNLIKEVGPKRKSISCQRIRKKYPFMNFEQMY